MRRACVIVLMGLVVTVAPSTPVGAIEQEWVLETPYRAEATAIDVAGNVYVAGDTGYTATLTKLAPDGSMLWRRSWSPALDYVWTGSVAVTIGDDGSVYWAGGGTMPCMKGGGLDHPGWFVRKLTASGRLLWSRVEAAWKHPCSGRGGWITDLSVGHGLVAASMTRPREDPTGSTRFDGVVVAFGPNGGVRWEAAFEPPDLPQALDDFATGVAVGAFDNVYAVGWGASSRRWDAGGWPALSKISSRGAVLWTRRLPVTSQDVDFWQSTDVAARGDAVVVATEARGPSIEWGARTSSAWLGRLTTGGDLVWSRTWGERWNVGAEPAQVALDPRTGAWVVGTQREPDDRGVGYDMFIRRYAPTGRLLWVRVLEGPTNQMFGTGIAAASDVVVATGYERRRETGRVFKYST